MVNEYKKIVLLTGLIGISDHDFKMVKSLLSKELKLNKKMQDDYDRIYIADLMEDKFPKDAGIDQLIELYKEMPGLGDLSDKLKREKAKVKRKETERSNSARRHRRDELNTSQRMSITNEDSEPESGRSTLNSQASWVSRGTASNRDQATQLSPSIASSCVQARRKFPARACSSVQAHRVSPERASSSVQAGRGFPVRACSSIQARRVSPARACSSVQARRVSPARACSSVQARRVSPARASSNVQARRGFPARACSSDQGHRLSPERASSSVQTRRGFPVRACSSVQARIVSPARASSSVQVQRVFPVIPTKKPRLKSVPVLPSEEVGHHQGPKKVMVLKATEPFIYDIRETKRMFHATVATETEFFRVKVFDITLKKKFIPNKVIILSDYIGHNGFINIKSASSVSEVNGNELMHIPTTLRQQANATPKINYLCSQRRMFVNGVFWVSQKNVRKDCVCYVIQDDTGIIKVVVYGRLASVACNPGDKLRLWCFELTSCEDNMQLRSTRHSNMEVIKTGK